MESFIHTFSIKTLLVLLKSRRRMTLEELVKEMGEQHGSITHTIDTVRSKTRRSFLGEVHHTSRMSTSHPWADVLRS